MTSAAWEKEEEERDKGDMSFSVVDWFLGCCWLPICATNPGSKILGGLVSLNFFVERCSLCTTKHSSKLWDPDQNSSN